MTIYGFAVLDIAACVYLVSVAFHLVGVVVGLLFAWFKE